VILRDLHYVVILCSFRDLFDKHAILPFLKFKFPLRIIVKILEITVNP
jgi:hypothetical protein